MHTIQTIAAKYGIPEELIHAVHNGNTFSRVYVTTQQVAAKIKSTEPPLKIEQQNKTIWEVII